MPHLEAVFLDQKGTITVRRSDILGRLTLPFGSQTFTEQTVSRAGAVVLMPAPLRQGQSFVCVQSACQSSNFLMGNFLNATQTLPK